MIPRREQAQAAMVVPPYDIEAEQSVLGSILVSGRVMQHLALETGLREDDFYRDAHRHIYAAMCALFHSGEPVDQLTVLDQLRRSGTLEACGGDVAVDLLAGTVPNVGNVHRYATIVSDLAIARRLLMATYEIQSEIAARRHDGDELVEQAERRVFALRSERLSARQNTLEQAVSDELERGGRQGRADDPGAADRHRGPRPDPGWPPGRPAVRDRGAAVDGQVAACFADRPARRDGRAAAGVVRVA